MSDPHQVEILSGQKKGEWVTFRGRTKDGKEASVDIHQKTLDGKTTHKETERLIKRSIYGVSRGEAKE